MRRLVPCASDFRCCPRKSPGGALSGACLCRPSFQPSFGSRVSSLGSLPGPSSSKLTWSSLIWYLQDSGLLVPRSPGHEGARARGPGGPRHRLTKLKGPEKGGDEARKGFISGRPTRKDRGLASQTRSPEPRKCFQVYIQEKMGQRLAATCRWAVKVGGCCPGVSHTRPSWLRPPLLLEGIVLVSIRGCFARRVFCLS